MKVVSNFVHNPLVTTDCRINCLSDIFNYNGIKITEEFCFGLGEGLDFNYWVENNTKIPITMVAGRDMKIEYKLCSNLNVLLKCHNNKAPDVEGIIAQIDNDKVIMADVDRFYLDYLNLDKAHFGYHAINIAGYKKENTLLFGIYDCLKKDLIWYPSEKLNIARGYDCELFKPEYKWYEFVFGDKTKMTIETEDVTSSIINVCNKMLSKNIGGIDLLIKFACQLEEFIGSDNSIKSMVRIQLLFLQKFISEFDVTGTMCRRIYANFLNQVYDSYINKDYIKNSCRKLIEISEYWRDLACKLAEDCSVESKLGTLYTDMLKIASKERELFTYLFQNIN